MSDNITLPREVVEKALEALEDFVYHGESMGWTQVVDALRTALAATKQEPVAYFDLQKQVFFWAKPTVIDVPMTVALKPLPLYFAPPAAAPEPTHPGYIIGNHWLETAYSRVCAGEAEADVLRDCGWERVTDAEALRRDAERLTADNERLREALTYDWDQLDACRESLREHMVEIKRLREALGKSLTHEQILRIAATIDRSMPLESAKILFARRIEAALRREDV